MQSMKENHSELKQILEEMRTESKNLPATIGREIRRAIRRCRKRPPEVMAKPESDEDKTLVRTWHRTAITALVVLIGVVIVWAKTASGGGIKDAPDKPAIVTAK